jgi:hypothetical protein
VSILLRHALPRTIERGVLTTLSADVRDSAGTEQTCTAATVAISASGRTILAATAATSLGPPVTYSLAATDEDESLSESWLEVWTVTIGGVVYHLRRPAMHVRHAWHPTITDLDLVNGRHGDLLNDQVKPSNIDTYETYRNAAEEMIQRELFRKGRRPHLIFDAWELVDCHIECTLWLIFADFHSAIGDGRYKDLAIGEDGKGGYKKAWRDSFDALQFRYDAAQSGTIDTNDTVASSPIVTLTAGRPNTRSYSGRGIGGHR